MPKKVDKKKKEEKIPHYISIEWEGNKYEFRAWKEYHPRLGAEVLCAWGTSVWPMHIQISRMFCIKTLDELKHIILCAFENQKKDRPKFDLMEIERLKQQEDEDKKPPEWHQERMKIRMERADKIIKETTARSKSIYG